MYEQGCRNLKKNYPARRVKMYLLARKQNNSLRIYRRKEHVELVD